MAMRAGTEVSIEISHLENSRLKWRKLWLGYAGLGILFSRFPAFCSAVLPQSQFRSLVEALERLLPLLQSRGAQLTDPPRFGHWVDGKQRAHGA